MVKYELLSKNNYSNIFHKNGLWVKPDLHKHVSEIIEKELDEIAKILRVDMLKKHKTKVTINDFNIAFAKYKESYLIEFITSVMNRIKSGLNIYEKEVKDYYEAYRHMPDGIERKE